MSDVPMSNMGMYDSQQGERTKSRFTPAFWGCAAGTLIFFLILALALSFSTRAFLSYGISSDLSEYHKIIDEADIDPAQKKQVLDQIESLREKVRHGKHPGFWGWLDYDESIRSLIGDGKISERDLEELTRELERMEKSAGE